MAWDRLLFLKHFLVPLGTRVLDEIESISCEDRFTAYLRQTCLRFDILLKGPNKKHDFGTSYSGGFTVDIFEFYDVGLSPWEVAEFLKENLTEDEILIIATESAVIRDIIQEDTERFPPEAIVARVDFETAILNSQQEEILRSARAALNFDSKFQHLGEKIKAHQDEVGL